MLDDIEPRGGGELDGEGRLRVVRGGSPHRPAVVVHGERRRVAVLLGRALGQGVHRVHLVDGDGDGGGHGGRKGRAGRRLRRVRDRAGHQAVRIERDLVHPDAPAARRVGEHDGVELPPFVLVLDLDDGAVGRAGHEAFRLPEQGVVGRIGIGPERGSGRVIALGIGFPLGAGGRVLEVVDAVPLDYPGTFDPGDARILVHLPIALPGVHGIEAEQVDRGAGEGGQVVRVQPDAVDAADAASGPEQVRLAVVIDIDLGVEAAVPALLDRTGVLEEAEVLVRSERMVRHEDVVRVAGQVELPLVLDEVRRHGDVLHGVELPVQQVVGHPHAAAGAAHVVLAAFLEDGDVARGVASLSDGHREGIAIALRVRGQARGQRQQGSDQGSQSHIGIRIFLGRFSPACRSGSLSGGR